MISLSKSAVYVVQGMVKGKSNCGIRVKKTEAGCSGLYFDIVLDKKKKGDVTLKKHGKLSVFADIQTKEKLYSMPKKHFQPAIVDYAKTNHGFGFITENHMVRINIFGPDLE